MNSSMDMKNYMDTHVYNIKVGSTYEFGEIFYDRGHLLHLYSLEPNELPTFQDDYNEIVERLLIKAETVLRALRKGTWRGHKYEIPVRGSMYRKHDDFLIFNSRSNYNREDKVIRDDFEVMTNLGFEYVDGKKLDNSYDGPLTPDEVKEFKQYLKNRFSHFDISYS